MGKYRNFRTVGGQTTVDLATAMIAAIAAREADLRKVTDSHEIFAKMNASNEVTITAKALNEYRTVAKFSMAPLPGCCGVCVSYHAQIETQFRRRGIGGILLEVREDAAERAGYTVVLATVLTSNEEERNLLRRHSWQEVGEAFKNKRTGNDVRFLKKVLVY